MIERGGAYGLREQGSPPAPTAPPAPSIPASTVADKGPRETYRLSEVIEEGPHADWHAAIMVALADGRPRSAASLLLAAKTVRPETSYGTAVSWLRRQADAGRLKKSGVRGEYALAQVDS